MDVSDAWDFLNERKLFVGSALGGAQHNGQDLSLSWGKLPLPKENSIQQAARSLVPQNDTFT